MFFGESVMRSPPGQRNQPQNQGNSTYLERDALDIAIEYSNTSRVIRPFMSALSTMHGPQQIEELERKKRQQMELAEILRQQIEDKKRRGRGNETYKSVSTKASNMLNNQYSETQTYTPSSYNSENFAQTLPNSQIKPKMITDPILIPPATRIESHIKTQNFAQTAPAQQLKLLHHMLGNPTQPRIDIPSESPFIRSSVSTPPLGFSLRKSLPSKILNSQTSPSRNAGKSILSRTSVQRSSYQGPPSYSFERSAPLENRLSTASELIYPDGHISAVDSPRD